MRTIRSLAPWGSLIWRNVDTPFAYADDSALYPKMPLHVPGYDPRAGHIMGQWMASIPARLAPLDPTKPAQRPIEQPYEEVFPVDADYRKALDDAAVRVEEYSKGERYNYIVEQDDIVAREVQSGEALTPQSSRVDPFAFPYDPKYVKFSFGLRNWNDQVPDRPHWVVSDVTENPGDWVPRRDDWADYLVHGTAAPDPSKTIEVIALENSAIGANSRRASRACVEADSVRLLGTARRMQLCRRAYGRRFSREG